VEYLRGSVLGLIRFLIFINDLDYEIINWILKFAEDTKIFGPLCNTDDYQRFQKDLNHLLSWTKDWQMSFKLTNVKLCTL